MTLNSKNMSFTTDKEVAVIIGDRLRQYRVIARLTRKDLSQRMGVSLSTVRNIEKGVSGTIDHLVTFLRATGRIEQINALVEPPQLSPLVIAKAQKNPLSRVRKTQRRKK
jgi:transcriptional regulator with XRE-family HTH domain